MDSIGSNCEDFRSVIDDLTVENKRLKQKLKKYHIYHRSRVENDKLFEIHVHGLPPSKKRKLEHTLQDFASTVSTTSNGMPVVEVKDSSIKPLDNPSHWIKSVSNSTSYSLPIDSTYASMSASGQTSTSYLQRSRRSRSSQTKQVVRKDIKAYLHDIPAGLLPRKSPVMTEKAKTKLVVRRLEQLFLGKDSDSSLDSQFLQQQQISQSAAEGERSANEAKGRRVDAEGPREARINPHNAEILGDSPSEGLALTSSGASIGGNISKPNYPKKSGNSIPDQRPTRPLDLDPCRAQVPAENIAYIRHLGLASPKLNSPPHGDGWIYLNLLISMAQLHTINVTADFVRKAVASVSRKFELSKDGQKIRWRGDTQGSSISSDGGSALEPSDAAMVEFASQPVNSRHNLGQYRDLKLQAYSSSETGALNSPKDYSSIHYGASSIRRPIFLGQLKPHSRFDYKPLFFQGATSEEENHRYIPNDESLTSSCILEDPTRCSLERSTFRGSCTDAETNAIRKAKEGPIIFYRGASFFTDLSGDSETASCLVADVLNDRNVLGCAVSTTIKSESALRESGDLTPEWSFHGDEEDNLEELHWTTSGNNYYNVEHDESVCFGQAAAQFEASGVGGICPGDHFVVHVEIRYLVRTGPPMSQLSLGHPTMRLPLHSFPPDFISSFSFTKSSEANTTDVIIQSDVISATTVFLPPSSLPPPSYVFPPFSSMESDNGEVDLFEFNSGCDSAFTHTKGSNPSTISALLYDSPGKVLSSTASLEASEDSSMDLLAHARELDPETIAAQEREFESNIIQMSNFVERIPACSSELLLDEESELWSQTSSSTIGFDNDDAEISSRSGLKQGCSEGDGLCGPSKVQRLI